MNAHLFLGTFSNRLTYILRSIKLVRFSQLNKQTIVALWAIVAKVSNKVLLHQIKQGLGQNQIYQPIQTSLGIEAHLKVTKFSQMA